jgi:hypothetical protein
VVVGNGVLGDATRREREREEEEGDEVESVCLSFFFMCRVKQQVGILLHKRLIFVSLFNDQLIYPLAQ